MCRNRYMLLWVSLLMVVGVGCSESGVAEREKAERGSQLYRKAFDAEQSGDLKEAIRLYNRVLIEEPRSYSAHFQLATLLHDHAEDYIGAIYHYKQYLSLRPETEKGTLAQDRIRIAEQLLAPQILRKVGDSVQGISQAHLLNENDRLNRLITTLEGEKSRLSESFDAAEKERLALKSDNEHLRDILQKMRISEGVSEKNRSVIGVERDASGGGAGPSSQKTDVETLRSLRQEAKDLSDQTTKPEPIRKPVVEVPSGESMLQKVRARLMGTDKSEPAQAETAVPSTEQSSVVVPSGNSQTMPDKEVLSSLDLFGRGEKKAKKNPRAESQRTYVVQPGDSLFRVAEEVLWGSNAMETDS